jgi:hypothetical protein
LVLTALLICQLACVATDSPAASDNKVIELILDASGSMNAKLPGAGSKIDAARSAVEQVVTALPPSTQLAFRAYGHQSPREKHDCDDTQMLVPFKPVSENGATVVSQARHIQAQGYTPITHVLQLAATDFPADTAGERIIILVSDGKETCEGDPCTAARALAAAGAKLVIHTIGFGVDSAARLQLQCIASATGGTYFDAESAAQLAKALGQAVAAPMKKVVVEAAAPGTLTIQGANLMGHQVTEATTGQSVGEISSFQRTLKLPAGVYNVTFGAATWKSVVVEAGKLTTLSPGVLTVQGAGIAGHKVLDSETGIVQGEVSSVVNRITILPGVYDVTFGNIVWPFVKVDGGTVTTLNPGRITVTQASFQGHTIRTAEGKEVGQVSSMGNSLSLPPGEYTVEISGKPVPFSITEGKTVEVKAQ